MVESGRGLSANFLLVVEVDARQVGGQQVGGKLNALEIPSDGLGKGPQQHGLAGAGHVLQQHVARADKAGEHLLDHVLED